MNSKIGLFVSIEGPNGSGKSSLAKAVARRLTKLGLDVLITKEPTDSFLGNFVRDAEKLYDGLTLAFLIAADRQFHVEHDIRPAIKSGKIVISDRYIESSLVLQRLDGLDLETIWSINRNFPVPDLSVILTAFFDTLNKRLAERIKHSRFEKTKSRKDELLLYVQAAEFLKSNGFNVLIIENDATPLEHNAEKIVQMILSLNPR